MCLIDPHGQLYDELLHYISHRAPRLAGRIILFNPAEDLDRVLGFNPIPANTGNTDYIVNMLTSAVLKSLGQDSQAYTPRISRWLKNIFYPLVTNNLTLLEAVPFFNVYDSSKRQDILKNIQNEQVLSDWIEFDKSSPRDRIQTIEGAANRLVNFLENQAIRYMIGQSSKTIDLLKVMEEGKILLVKLNGGIKIPYENTHLLGVMLVNELFRVSKLRDARNPNLLPFRLYIDEFGQYVTRDIARALEECRKYKLFLTLAHQHLAQLKREDEYLYASVLTNCKNKVVFGGLSKEDAEVMTDEIATGFLDLRSIKDEMYTTKVRHIEETRIVTNRSHSTSETDTQGEGQGVSHSESQTLSQSESQTDGQGRTVGSSEGQTDTTSRTDTNTTSQSQTKSQTRGQTKGYSDTVGEGYSKTEGRSESHSEGTTQSQNWSETEGKNSSRTITEGKSGSRTHVDGRSFQPDGLGFDETGRSRSDSRSKSNNRSEGRTEGESSSKTQGGGTAYNDSYTHGTNESESHSRNTSHTDQFSESETYGVANQEGSSESVAHGSSTARSRQTSQSESVTSSQTRGSSQADTKGTTTQKSTSWSKAQTQGQSEGESIVPFLRPEEYSELVSRTFWTKEELSYMQMAEIKNQDTGTAFIKINTEAPVQVKIDYVDTPHYSPRTSPKKNDRFINAVFEAHSQYYTPVLEARNEYEMRQRSLFSDGEPLRFDEAPMIANQMVIDGDGSGPMIVEDPFVE